MNEFFEGIDNMDSAFSQYKSECQGCDMFPPVNGLGLCNQPTES